MSPKTAAAVLLLLLLLITAIFRLIRWGVPSVQDVIEVQECKKDQVIQAAAGGKRHVSCCNAAVVDGMLVVVAWFNG